MLLLSILYPYLQSVSPFLTQIYGVMFLFLAFLSVEVYRATNSKEVEPVVRSVPSDGGSVLSLSTKEEEIRKKSLLFILFIFFDRIIRMHIELFFSVTWTLTLLRLQSLVDHL